MNTEHDRAVGDEPWKVIPPIQREVYTRDNPLIEGGAKFWTEGQFPDEVHIISVGPGGEYVVQIGNAWVPDEIHRQFQEMSLDPNG